MKQNGSFTNRPTAKKGENLTARRCVRTHPSLPPWGARLQATVEFCKQNIECRTYVRRMRCSKFVPRKRRTPHPSCLTAIHLPHGGRLTKSEEERKRTFIDENVLFSIEKLFFLCYNYNKDNNFWGIMYGNLNAKRFS